MLSKRLFESLLQGLRPDVRSGASLFADAFASRRSRAGPAADGLIRSMAALKRCRVPEAARVDARAVKRPGSTGTAIFVFRLNESLKPQSGS